MRYCNNKLTSPSPMDDNMFSLENLDLVAMKEPNDLCGIMTRFLSDKASGPHSRHHNYTKLYSEMFSPLRYERLNVLEIGIGSVNTNIPSNMTGGDLGHHYKPGASVRGWHAYFPNANIFACDIDRDILDFEEPRVTGFYFDQTNEDQIIDTINNGALKNVMFDIIIDDGLHHFPTNCDVMKHLLPRVKAGGYYIIEDIIHTEYNKCHLDLESVSGKGFRYVRFPNPHNNADNNLFIVSC